MTRTYLTVSISSVFSGCKVSEKAKWLWEASKVNSFAHDIFIKLDALGDDDFRFPLSKVTKVNYEHIWKARIWKTTPNRRLSLTVTIFFFFFQVAREVLLPHRSGNQQYQFTLNRTQAFLFDNHFQYCWFIQGLFKSPVYAISSLSLESSKVLSVCSQIISQTLFLS